MGNVPEAAERYRAWLAANGARCGAIDNSTNREGGSSSYFDVVVDGVSTRVRISDHSANATYRVGETHVDYSLATDEHAKRLIAEMIASGHRAKAEEARKQAERDAYEAPYRARYLSAKPHEQHAILCEAYPAAAQNKQWRQEIMGRWRARPSTEEK